MNPHVLRKLYIWGRTHTSQCRMKHLSSNTNQVQSRLLSSTKVKWHRTSMYHQKWKKWQLTLPKLISSQCFKWENLQSLQQRPIFHLCTSTLHSYPLLKFTFVNSNRIKLYRRINHYYHLWLSSSRHYLCCNFLASTNILYWLKYIQ